VNGYDELKLNKQWGDDEKSNGEFIIQFSLSRFLTQLPLTDKQS